MKKSLLITLGLAVFLMCGCQSTPQTTATYNDLVTLTNPLPNQVIESPLQVTGQARGTWFFEGTFPVSIVNWDGLIIGETYAIATSD